MHGRRHLFALAGVIVLGCILFAVSFRASATGLFGSAIVETTPGARREKQPSEIAAPAISFIDNPSPTCYQPVASDNTCYVTWNSLSVTAGSSQYMISMTVSIDNRLRAYHSGFFQTSMSIPGDLYGPGLQVACGPRSAGGAGNTYAYTVRAMETGGLSSANYGSVTCPGVVLVHLPIIRR
jgi:hypothetical protein